MRIACAVVVVAGCGFRAPSQAPADAPAFDDGGHEFRMWSFDTAAEFGAPGHDAIAMTIEPRGSLTPDGYLYGGLMARGIDNMRLWTHGDTGWDKLDAITPSGIGLWPGNNLNVTNDLRYVGITHPALSIAFEGEVFLQAGVAETLRIQGNDIGFVQLAQPGTTVFTQIADNADVPVTVAASAWYPIRVGWANGDATGDFQFLRSEGGKPFGTFPRDRIRARASVLQGTMRSVYFHQLHGGGIGSASPVFHLEDGALSEMTAFNPPLQGSYTGTPTAVFDWSARWTGQFYAEVAGSYTFQVDSSDGDRLMLADQIQESKWRRNDSASVSSTVTANLEPGWNDLVVDYNNATSTPAFKVSVTASPDANLPAGPIPVDRLRPVEPRAERIATTAGVNPVTVTDGQSRSVPLGISSLAADEVVTAVELTVVFTSQDESQLSFKLVASNNATNVGPGVISDAGSVSRAYGVYITDPAFLTGIAAAGPWTVTISDHPGGGGNTTVVSDVHLTVHTSGGADQIARSATWMSPVLDTQTRLFAVDAVTWDERLPAGAGMVVQMRSCDQPDCSDGTWSAAIAKGTGPALPAKRYLQARVDLTSDGVHEPEVRSLSATFRRDAM